MMRRILFIAGILFLLLLVSFSIPVSQKKEIIIASSFNQTLNEIRQPKNWVRWHPDINREWKQDPHQVVSETDSLNNYFEIRIPGKIFKVKQLDAITYEITETKNKKTSQYVYVITPSIEGDSTIVLIAGKSSLLYSVFPFLDNNITGTSAIEQLRSFMQDDSLYYGYAIGLETVPDTVVATKSMVIAASQAINAIPVLSDEIRGYVLANNLIPKDYTYISFHNNNNDSVQLYVGIPVNKEAAASNGIVCRKMPAGARMITGEFEGKFSDRQLLYEAVDKYMADKQFQKVALPYEKYGNTSLPRSGASEIKTKIYFPVY